MDEHAWLRKGAAILTDMKEWRRARPTATFVEIEDEVHRRMMELEVQVLQDAAQESLSREWGQTPGQPPPVCPVCTVPLKARGQHQRTLQGNGGQSVTLSRTYGTCPSCQKSFFPLDRELQLLPGSLAPRQQEHLVHLASCLPFEQAARLLGDLLGVQVNAETARRLTEHMGAWMDVAQLEEAEPVPSEPSVSASTAEREQRVLSVDGAMISLVHTQWVEVRTLAIGEPESQQGATGETEVHVGHLSYFSCLSDASTFTELTQGEMRRRKVAQTAHVCAVTDGAEWCQAFAERYRPDAVRMLDFPHAAEHLSALLEGCSQVGKPLPDQMLSRCLHVLKHRGPAPLLRMADRLPLAFAQQKGVQEHVEYLRKREASMQYPQFRAQGWPIGSGIVESANKLVVQARLKGPGMHWERKNVNPLLALRLAVCYDRWAEMWGKTLAVVQRRSASPELPLSAHPSGSPSSTPTPKDPAGCLAQQSHVQQASRRRSTSACPHRLSPNANPEARTTATEAPVCRSCGAQVMQVRGQRKRLYCSDICRKRAYRVRCTTDSSRRSLPERIKQEVLTRLPHTPIKQLGSPHPSPQPFVKERADRCPCGTPVVVPGRGHRPMLYCSARCRMRAIDPKRHPS